MKTVRISECSNRSELKELLQREGLSLSPDEARRVVDILKRNPTKVEIHIFDIMWSEHCSYKSSKTHLEKWLPTSASNVIQGPEEDAGIVSLCHHEGREIGLVVAHESHNHPSQILPVEGAATGIGGILRDVYCMGADVVGVMDGLRFGNPSGKSGAVVKEIAGNVIKGIWQYANPAGIPNLGGDLYFDDSFDDNCLVNVVAVGVVEREQILHSRVPIEAGTEPYVLILVGKPTDSTGFGGATFASGILDEAHEEGNKGAVQIPDPFLKRMLYLSNRAVMDLIREKGAAAGFKDLGAGGLACASSEMGASAGFGIEINLDSVPAGDVDTAAEILACSETQERYLWIVPERLAPEILNIYNEIYQLPEIYRGAFAAVIGRVKKEPKFRVLFDGMPVCDASIDAITSGIRYNRPQTSRAIENNEADFPMESPDDLFETVMLMAEGPHISSREPIFRQYDTEVQGNAVIRAGEADAGVISPIPGNPVGIAFSIDGNPRYCRLNPYMGAAAAVAEGFRNVAAVGAYPVCITDCLNFGNPEDPIVMHQFTESLRGISDACRLIYQKDRREEPVPVVSGNVSFYNQSASGKAVAPSPIIATYGILEDYSIAVDMKLKNPGNPVFLLGTRKNELGGSVYLLEKYHIRNRGTVPRIDFEEERKRNLLVANSIEKGLVTAAHDISDGGLLVCAMEMCSDKRNMGISIEISKIPDGLRPDIFLFTETPGFLLEVASSAEDSFIRKAKTVGVDFERIGRTTEDGKAVFDIDGYTLPPIDVKKFYEITSSGLKKHIF